MPTTRRCGSSASTGCRRRRSPPRPADTRREDDMTAPRVALVTGANRGIGLAVAAELRARGLAVVVTARDADAAAQAAAELGPQVRAHPLDVTDAESVRLAYKQVGPV